MAAFLNYTVEDRESVKVVNLSGDITSLTRDELISTIGGLSSRSNVILNLREVGLVTSSGLDALVEVATAARAGSKRILLMGVHESLVKLIDQLDLYEHFIFVESVEQGLMKLRFYG